jgi:hypothetical protein
MAANTVQWIWRRTRVWWLLLLLLSACGGGPTAPTPEAAVLISEDMTLGLSNMRIEGRRQHGNAAIVLYSATQPATVRSPALAIFGYAYVRQSPWGWGLHAGGSSGSSMPLPRETTLDYGLGSFRVGVQRYSVVYGRTLHPAVTVVEAVLHNGKVLRDSVTQGVFAILITGAQPVCELRALDIQEHPILDENDVMPADCA